MLPWPQPRTVPVTNYRARQRDDPDDPVEVRQRAYASGYLPVTYGPVAAGRRRGTVKAWHGSFTLSRVLTADGSVVMGVTSTITRRSTLP